ncbi:hypothetical protein J2S43_003502 [Catenuloplanes nepalensis]|uniref:DUF4097 domain-containing protein n=1 Tax=Catenuloplanes nepalensis TaxID=587533 RepID=A0ABT9MU63_9ACTN|nr:DUF4097 family beta strand repeat-containing protein [Catenuloplanes nepalensis]MDP9794990.1 hypothetical protein [Catenuloplanes nepalensis]
MPVFETPESISVTVELGAGDVRFIATDRTDTVVEVRPADDHDESDVRTAAQVQADFSGGVLRVTGPRIRPFDISRESRSVDVSVALPSGSSVTADLQLGDIGGTGRLGRCALRTAAGNLRLEQTGPLRLETAAGHVTADAVTGGAEISTGSGRVHLGTVDGTVAIKNSNGETTIDAATGDVRARSANGDIRVARAGADVDAKTSNGRIEIGEAVRGAITLETAMGDLEVGIAAGTAAWLDVDTRFGKVRNLLDGTSGPGDAAETVEVRGRTSFGDVTIQRA